MDGLKIDKLHLIREESASDVMDFLYNLFGVDFQFHQSNGGRLIEWRTAIYGLPVVVHEEEHKGKPVTFIEIGTTYKDEPKLGVVMKILYKIRLPS